MNYETLASQLIRAIRGQRSQMGLSKRIGCQSNVVYSWEAGLGFPTASRFFLLLRRVGKDPKTVLQNFYTREPAFLEHADLTCPEGVVAFLVDLKGRQSIKQLAQVSGRDRFAVSRWLKGTTEPRLPDFLRMLEATSLRLLDFLGTVVEPSLLPEVAADWHRLEAGRQAARVAPWSQAVLQMMQLVAYETSERHAPGFFAQRLGLSLEQERESLELLLASRQVVRKNGRYRVNPTPTVDTRRDTDATRRLAAWCSSEGLKRIEAGHQGHFAFNLFGVSTTDFERLRQLQREYFAQLRAIVAESKPVERVAITNVQLFAIGELL